MQHADACIVQRPRSHPALRIGRLLRGQDAARHLIPERAQATIIAALERAAAVEWLDLASLTIRLAKHPTFCAARSLVGTRWLEAMTALAKEAARPIHRTKLGEATANARYSLAVTSDGKVGPSAGVLRPPHAAKCDNVQGVGVSSHSSQRRPSRHYGYCRPVCVAAAEAEG